MIKRYILYLGRWQLSTPILAVCMWLLASGLGTAWATVIANLIGGLAFFWVDRMIFTRTNILFDGELWEVRNAACADCRKAGRSYRLVKAAGYDKSRDKEPEFRCHECSRAKHARDWPVARPENVR